MHVATRITGPRHNYLAITFDTEKSATDPVVVELPAQGGCEHRPLDTKKILEAVLEGVTQANADFDTDYVVQYVHVVKNDTGPEDVYRHMAYSIVEETKKHLEQQSQNFQKLMRDSKKRKAT